MDRGVLVFLVNSFAKNSINLSSIWSAPMDEEDEEARTEARPSRMERRERARDEDPRSIISWVRSAGSVEGKAVVVAATAPASSINWRTVIPASLAATSRADFCVSENQAGIEITAPVIFFPRKSEADCRREARNIDVTSCGVKIR